MSWRILDGWWTDAGTFDSLLQAGHLVSQMSCYQQDDRDL